MILLHRTSLKVSPIPMAKSHYILILLNKATSVADMPLLVTSMRAECKQFKLRSGFRITLWDIQGLLKSRGAWYKYLQQWTVLCGVHLRKSILSTCKSFLWKSFPTFHIWNTFCSQSHLFKDDTSDIFDNIPESKKRKANKEPKGAAKVRNQRTKVVAQDLGK